MGMVKALRKETLQVIRVTAVQQHVLLPSSGILLLFQELMLVQVVRLVVVPHPLVQATRLRRIKAILVIPCMNIR